MYFVLLYHLCLRPACCTGSEFFNLLAMKPVLDSQGRYAYVIGVQYDISQRTATKRDLKRVDDLLSLLPSILH